MSPKHRGWAVLVPLVCVVCGGFLLQKSLGEATASPDLARLAPLDPGIASISWLLVLAAALTLTLLGRAWAHEHVLRALAGAAVTFVPLTLLFVGGNRMYQQAQSCPIRSYCLDSPAYPATAQDAIIALVLVILALTATVMITLSLLAEVGSTVRGPERDPRPR